MAQRLVPTVVQVKSPVGYVHYSELAILGDSGYNAFGRLVEEERRRSAHVQHAPAYFLTDQCVKLRAATRGDPLLSRMRMEKEPPFGLLSVIKSNWGGVF